MLTTGVDTVPGSTGVDVFEGTISAQSTGSGAGTLQATDKIDGAGGSDRLSLKVNADFTGFSTGFLKNVETLALEIGSAATTTTFNAKGSSEVTSLSISNALDGNVTVNDLNTGLKSVSINGGQKADTYTTTLVVTAPERISTSTSDSIAVTLNAVGVSASSRGTLDLGGFEVLNATLQGNNHVTLGNDVRTFKVDSGSGSLTLAGGTAIRTIDASGATGAIAVDTTAVTTAQQVTTLKFGSGGGSITSDMQELSPVAAITGGAGADSLVLNSTDNVTFAPVMSGVETVRFNNITAATTVTFSGTQVTGLTTIETQAPTTGNVGTVGTVTVAGLGASNLTINARGATPDGALTTTHSGTTTLNYKAVGTAAAAGTGVDLPLGDYALANTSALTVNVEAFVDVNAGSTITAAAAKSVTVNVASGKVGGAEATEYAGVITAGEATSVTFNVTGEVDGAAVTALKATSLTVNNGSTAGSISFTGATAAADAKLSSLNIATASNLTLTLPQALAALETLTVSSTAGGVVAFPASSDFAKLGTLTLSGTGSTAAVTGIDELGDAANNANLTVTASGLTGGLTLGALKVAAGKDVTVGLTGTTGNVVIGNISEAAAGNVTITAPGIGTKAVATNGLQVGNISANTTTGTVTIDASGVRAPIIGTVAANKVTVNFANATEGTGVAGTKPAVGAVTAGSEANLTLYALGTNTQTINGTGTTGSLAVTINGGILDDAITVNLGAKPSLVMTGSLGDSTTGDSVVVNVANITTARNIDLSGLTASGLLKTTISGSSGADTIKGSSGTDTIISGPGKNVLTGGAGADQFVFNLGVSTLASVGSAANLTEITDFQAIDRIAAGFGTTAVAGGTTPITTATAVNATAQLAGATADITRSNGGYTFSGTTASSLTLEQKVAIIDQHLNNPTAGEMAFFLHGGTTYAYIDNGSLGASDNYTNSIVVKLTGLSSLPGVAFADVDSTASTAADPTPTGLFGFGG